MGNHMPIGNTHNRGAGEQGRARVPRRRSRGFTIVELMVVITIIVLLVTVAIPIYNNTIRRANESVLKSNLSTLREVLDTYTGDKQKAPQSLQDLVSAGYLREIPFDPIARTQNWTIIMEDASQSISQSEPGIFDVKSTSSKTSSEGTPYSQW
jgi:general secretion pathway protein G